jgi:transposase
MTITLCGEFDVSHVASEVSSKTLAVLATRAGCALNRSIQPLVLASDQPLGHLEAKAAQDVEELLRQAIERGTQAKADATPPVCPVCGQPLSRLLDNHPRTFESRFGTISIRRTRGYCKHCRKRRVPADTALGLAETAGYSPAMQALAALLVSKMPVEDASAVLEHITGVQLPRATLDREAAAKESAPNGCAPNSMSTPPPKSGKAN